MTMLRNLITDVAGVSVGNAQDLALGSGVTALVFDAPAAASIAVTACTTVGGCQRAFTLEYDIGSKLQR